MKQRQHFVRHQRGFVSLVSVLLISIAGLSIALALLNSVTDSEQTSVATIRSHQAQSLATGCAEVALQRVHDLSSFTGGATLVLQNNNMCTYLVSNTGGSTRSIRASSTADGVVRKVLVSIDKVSPYIRITGWQDVVAQ